MKTVKMTTRGRVTIPKEIRERYEIKPGMKIYFFEKDGEIIIAPNNKYMFKAMAGILKDGPNLIEALMKEKKREREL